MNKAELIEHIAEQYKCTKVEAKKTIEMFTSSVIQALGEGKEIGLVGFGGFYVAGVDERVGHNPRTKEPIRIPAYNQPKFRAGQKLKDACNKVSFA